VAEEHHFDVCKCHISSGSVDFCVRRLEFSNLLIVRGCHKNGEAGWTIYRFRTMCLNGTGHRSRIRIDLVASLMIYSN
jgi:hypothetical protein